MACSNGTCSLGDNMAKKKKTSIGVQSSAPKPSLGTRIKEGLIGKEGQFVTNPLYGTNQNQLINTLTGQAQQGLQNQPDYSQFLGPLQQLLQQQMGRSYQGQGLLNQTLGNLQSNRYDFEPIEQRARTQFNQQTIPSLAERFTGMGGQNSSAFQQSLGQAGAGLEEGLAALRSQHGLQQQGQQQSLVSSLLNNLLGNQQFGGELAGTYGRLGLGALGQQNDRLSMLLNGGLTQQFNTSYQPGTNGIIGGLLNAVGQAAGAYAGGGAAGLGANLANRGYNWMTNAGIK